jgi:excisionase family DNA binding protein
MDTQIGSHKEKLEKAQWVAERMSVPLPSIYDFARRNIIPVVRIGRLMRFKPSDIERFIESGGKK